MVDLDLLFRTGDRDFVLFLRLCEGDLDLRFRTGDLDLLLLLTDLDLDRLFCVGEADLERFLRTGDVLLEDFDSLTLLGEGDRELPGRSS